MPEGWPLVGRAEELQVLDRLHRPGGSAGLVLAGAAGVGKTRLAREAVALAARRGLRTRWAAATASARALPLGAFGTAVGDAGSDPSQLLRRAVDTLLAGRALAASWSGSTTVTCSTTCRRRWCTSWC